MQDNCSDADILKRFMIEFFSFSELLSVGFFTKDIEGDYDAQAKRVCLFFGYKTVFEYGSQETRCHLSYIGKRPNQEFVTVIPSIYE